MIVKMKKVSVLVMDKDRAASLEKLRELGVVHVEKKEVTSEVLTSLLERKSKLDSASMILKNFAPKKNASTTGKAFEDAAAYVLGRFEKRKLDQEQIFANNKEISRIEKWGNFNPAEFKSINSTVEIYPYELSAKSYSKIKDDRLVVLRKEKNSVFCVSVGKALEGETQFVMPEFSLADLRKQSDTLTQEIASIEKELSTLTYLLSKIAEESIVIEEKIEFETAKVGMEKLEGAPEACTVSWVSGFVPQPEMGRLKRSAAENGWALYAVDPGVNERPPTLTKNNAFVRIIQPLFGFLGTVPGYKEYDISPSFLIFFCIFFAMIFGDAAYGSIIFIIVALIGISIKAKTGKLPDAIKLFGLLSLCTIAWGTINGAWFAIPYDSLPSVLQGLVIPQFNSKVELGLFPEPLRELFSLPEGFKPKDSAQWNIQFLCFSIAIIQLVYSHIKNIKKLLASRSVGVAISQLGWLVMMVGFYFLVLSMLLKLVLPPFAVYFIGGGLGAYFIFANQTGGNPFANIGKSFANFLPTFLNAVGAFADIISYIRLFAVGLAGTSIAQSFNSMSGLQGGLEGDISNIIIKVFAGALILVFGHGLNMVMNALSVIVHGVRLNLLEYAGNHLGMEWSGYSYKPFAQKQTAKK